MSSMEMVEAIGMVREGIQKAEAYSKEGNTASAKEALAKAQEEFIRMQNDGLLTPAAIEAFARKFDEVSRTVG